MAFARLILANRFFHSTVFYKSQIELYCLFNGLTRNSFIITVNSCTLFFRESHCGEAVNFIRNYSPMTRVGASYHKIRRNNCFGPCFGGGITYISFKPCCEKLRKSLQNTILSNPNYHPNLEEIPIKSEEQDEKEH